MKALRIRDWDRHYENNRSRELRRPEWLPLPNSFDGAGYMELCDNPAGTSHYGAWCMLLAAASRMPTRGLMVGDSGRPYSLKDIARMTRGQLAVFEEAVPRLLEIGWLEWAEVATPPGNTPSGEWRAPAAQDEAAGKPQADAAMPQDGAGSLRPKGKGNISKENENRDGAVAAAVPTRAAATTAPGKLRRLVGIDTAAARRAIESNDLVALIRACGGNLAGERAAEWARDCHNKTIPTIAVVLCWRFAMTQPVREPSGFRKAWALWCEDLNDEERRMLSVREMERLGVQVQVRQAPTPVPA